jgi:hypothetical protein
VSPAFMVRRKLRLVSAFAWPDKHHVSVVSAAPLVQRGEFWQGGVFSNFGPSLCPSVDWASGRPKLEFPQLR